MSMDSAKSDMERSSQSPGLFPAFEVSPEPPAALEVPGAARVRSPRRYQMEFRPLALDELLPDDHRARLVWQFVEGLDLSPLYEQIRAVEGRAGRDAIDPKILMALWLYATLEGVGSARELDCLCGQHHAYQWICGGVSVNYHTLSDFRTGHVEFLDTLLTRSVAALMAKGLVKLQRVSHDGVRVRASAGASSFRRRPTLEQCLVQAQQQVERLRKQMETPGGATQRQRKARERAAQQRLDRVNKALKELPKIEAMKKNADKGKARASTTDPDARVMKMPDGGYRSAGNVQFSADASQVITNVDVTNVGSDMGLLKPMLDQHQQRYGKTPQEVLADGGFSKQDDIQAAHDMGTVVYTPVPAPKNKQQDRYAIREHDSAVIAAWRTRMASPQGQEIYKERGETIECVNAQARNRGLQQFLVRGLTKMKAVALWFALAHNLVRAAALCAAAMA